MCGVFPADGRRGGGGLWQVAGLTLGDPCLVSQRGAKASCCSRSGFGGPEGVWKRPKAPRRCSVGSQDTAGPLHAQGVLEGWDSPVTGPQIPVPDSPWEASPCQHQAASSLGRGFTLQTHGSKLPPSSPGAATSCPALCFLPHTSSSLVRSSLCSSFSFSLFVFTMVLSIFHLPPPNPVACLCQPPVPDPSPSGSKPGNSVPAGRFHTSILVLSASLVSRTQKHNLKSSV